MSRKVFKYGPVSPLREKDVIRMPKHATIIHFEEQDGQLFFWAEVNEENYLTSREFKVIGTGWILPDDYKYHGTAIVKDSSLWLVWHLYEKT